ncbi:MAG TPA: hypothetical protein VFM38_07695 [Candidatus Limnocylindrales bacterium]|nr:hypothetical protein [Candidatus Limnocylindrales bacterium]
MVRLRHSGIGSVTLFALVLLTLAGVVWLVVRQDKAGQAAASLAAVTIDAGLTPALTPDQVMAVALQAQGPVGASVANPEALAVEWMRAVRARDVAAVVPGLGETMIPSTEIAWVVRLNGTMVGDRVPPGQSPVIGTGGWVVIRDTDGSIYDRGIETPAP